ncbi:membrane protein [Massilia sp. WF1]|uniref:hypothetical protein n=1 Tax=unclassified Massilia TaxID=2609279 RepID=UPI00064B01E2|nr:MULTISPECIES: hypothetical protein [unclassified Massilia]ALK98502.1 hypothetical protein AM586_22205 [Massilia sp. WG5]KLU37584.1 membrane protein [Massilia sp. WF1]
MTNARTRLFAPLVHLAAMFLLLEEWCWDVGARLGARLARWPLLAALEGRVRLLPPWGALCLFVLPGLLLLPVKLLALLAIAHGHAISGIATIVIAKLGGAAVVARLYALTLPTLLAVGWFARCHGWFMALKNRWVGRLRASPAFVQAGRRLRAARRALRRWRYRRGVRARSRHASRVSRVLRRFVVQWRARRR